MNKVLFSSQSPHWATPDSLYADIDEEFNFNDDPCPLHGLEFGLSMSWGSRTFCNPPYGTQITKWIKKGYSEAQQGKLVVFLIPSRTDTRWFHDYCMKASEIRFIRGRLKFSGAKYNAPFPSAIVIFNGGQRNENNTR